MGKKQGVSVAFVLMAGALWGTTGLLQALTPAGTPPLTVGSVRVVVASVIMLAFCLLKRGPGFLKKTRPGPLITAVAGMMGYQFAFFSALRLTGVSVGTMIAIGAIPMFGGLVGFLLEKEPLSPRWGLSTGVAVTGCTLLAFAGGGVMTARWSGVALAVLAAFSTVFMGLGIKRQGAAMTPLEASAVTLAGGALVGLPVLLALDSSWLLTPRGAVVATALGIVSMAVPLSVFAYGVQRVLLRDAYTLALVEPLTACILSAVVLGERLTPLSLAGVALIFLGISSLSPSQKGKLRHTRSCNDRLRHHRPEEDRAWKTKPGNSSRATRP